MRSLKKQTPNLLTLSRLLMAPVIFWLVIRGNNYQAIFFILLGATSDILDGVLARKFHVSSSFGRAFEHCVDKIYLVPIIYVVFRYLDIRFLILVALLEISTIVFSVTLAKKAERDWPNIWGKISYGFLVGGSCAALIGANESAAWATCFLLLGNMALAVTIAFRITSFIYFFKRWK